MVWQARDENDATKFIPRGSVIFVTSFCSPTFNLFPLLYIHCRTGISFNSMNSSHKETESKPTRAWFLCFYAQRFIRLSRNSYTSKASYKGKPVAVKTIHKHLCEQVLLQDFIREAKIACKLAAHPNVIMTLGHRPEKLLICLTS
jgi:hypothetical protein